MLITLIHSEIEKRYSKNPEWVGLQNDVMTEHLNKNVQINDTRARQSNSVRL